MKKYLLLVLVPVLTLALRAGAYAGVTPGSFSVSPYVGGYSFLGAEHLETGPVFGVRGGYNLTSHFGVEAVADFVDSEHKRGGGDVDVWNYHLDMLYHFMPDGPLVPYLAAGYGGQSRENPGGRDTTRGVFNYGVGVKAFLNQAMAIRGDLRHLVMRDDDDTFHNLEYTVGVDFLFGGTKAAAPAAPAVQAAPAPKEEPEPALEPVPAAEPEPGHFKYCITLQGEFDIDKAEIRPEYKDEIAQVGEFMKKYPTTTAVIEGHTDNVGDPQYNMDLSKRRAEAVMDYLVQNYGIDRSRLSARGYGMTRPIADNNTDEGRQLNRRIEAIIDCVFEIQEVQPPERLCIGLKVEYDTGDSSIKPEFKGELDKVGQFMKKYPTTTGVIEGHTDNVGGYDYNMKLSQARAQNVVDYLVQNFGIEPGRLSAKGFGYNRRVAYNSTPDGRAKNRRINAVIDCVVKK